MCQKKRRESFQFPIPYSTREQHLLVHMSTPKTMNIHHKSLRRARKPKQLGIHKLKRRLTAPHIMLETDRSTIPQLKHHKPRERTHPWRMNFHNPMPWEPQGINEIQPPLTTSYHRAPYSTLKRHNHFQRRAVLKWHKFLMTKPL